MDIGGSFEHLMIGADGEKGNKSIRIYVFTFHSFFCKLPSNKINPWANIRECSWEIPQMEERLLHMWEEPRSIPWFFKWLMHCFLLTSLQIAQESNKSIGKYVNYSLADNMRQGKKNSHCAVKKWCTGREWPVNCTTGTSARWRTHMPFQR